MSSLVPSSGERTDQVATAERFDDPGLHPHRVRRGDTDPRARRRAERQVLAAFGLSILGTLGFLVAYALVPPGETVASMRTSNLLLGGALALALAGIGLGAVHWAKSVMVDREIVEERHPIASDAATRAAAVDALRTAGTETGIGRRGLLKGAMVGALALFPLAIAVPLVGNVGGTWDITPLRHTWWRRGTRLAHDPSGRPIKADDLEVGSIVHVIPEDLHDAEDVLTEKAKAIVLLVRLDPADLVEAPDRAGWSYDGIVAYSKVCTHVGCPVALYEQQTHHLLCPCHQSTFDVADGAKVVFGPAKRALPQLPITVDDDGYLVAQSDFTEPVGPSFWERLR